MKSTNFLRLRCVSFISGAIYGSSSLVTTVAVAQDTPPAPESAAVSGPVQAAGELVEAPTPESLEVHVLGESDDSLQRVAGSRSLITGKDIDRMAPRDTGEILRRMPSVTVSSEDGHGLRLNIGLRGLDPTRSRSLLVLEDGVPISINPYGEPDLYYSTPVDRIRSVELLKGSGGIVYGPQTVGGVINFVTAAPPDRLEATTMIEAGQYGFFHALARYGDAVGPARFLSQLSFRRADGPRAIGVEAIDWMGKVAFPTSDTGEALLKVALYKESSQATYVGLTRDLFAQDPEQDSIAPNDEFKVDRADLSLTHRQQLTAGTDLRTLLYAHATHRVWRRQNYDRTVGPGARYVRTEGDIGIVGGALYFRDESTIRDRSYQVVGLEPQVESRFATGVVRHTLTAGVRGHFERGEREQRRTDVVVSNAGSAELRETQSVGAIAAYAQDRMAFRDWLLLTPGLRVEAASYARSTERELVDGVATDVDLSGRSFNLGVIPGLGMLLGVRELAAYGGLHVGYAPPRVSAAITAEGRDAALAAERSTNYELGVRSQPATGLSLEGTFFLMVFQNQIIAQTAASGGASELQNGGSTLHRGVEGTALIALGTMFDLGFDLDIAPKYTFVVATFRGGIFDGNQLPYAPQHHAQTSVAFAHPAGPGLEAAWSLVGPQYTDEVNTEAVDASGRVGLIETVNLLDVTARYRIPDSGITLSLSAKNVIGDIYVATRRPDGIQTAGFRQVLAGLRWDYPWQEPDTVE